MDSTPAGGSKDPGSRLTQNNNNDVIIIINFFMYRVSINVFTSFCAIHFRVMFFGCLFYLLIMLNLNENQ